MKAKLILVLMVVFHLQTTAQLVNLTLQPGAVDGKDAHIDTYYPNFIGGATQELDALSWTKSGTPYTVRGLLQFDLTSIPAGAIIQDATLTLYFNPNSANSINHQHLSGSNAAVLHRIVDPWSEASITWNNQPGYSTQNAATLPQDTSPTQNYIVNVTGLVQDMVNNPNSSYGFLLKLQTEQYYRGLVFASSDHPNAALHPKLEINYGLVTAPTGKASADGPTTFCAGDYVNLTATNNLGSTYQWLKNNVNITAATERTLKVTSSGTYKCQISNPMGTTTTNSVVVTVLANASSALSSVGPASFCAGDSVILNASNPGQQYSIQWYRNNISLLGASGYSITVKQPGVYKVVTKNNTTGCSRISSGSITTNVNCRLANPNLIATDYEETSLSGSNERLSNEVKKVLIYPNPNAGQFTIESNLDGFEGEVSIVVFNQLGQEILRKQTNISSGMLHESVNLGDNLQKGIFLVRIHTAQAYFDSRVMLQ